MVVLIVIIQALPDFLVGVISGRNDLLWGAAIIMTSIAALTGDSKYFTADLIGIVIAVGAAYFVMNIRSSR